MKKNILLTCLLVTITGLANSQKCGYYYFQNNKTITMGMYSGKKGNLNGKVVYKISGVTKNGTTTTSTIEADVFDKKGKSISSSSGKVKCNNGQLSIDMKLLMPPGQGGQFQDAKATAKGSDLEYPVALNTGQKLADGSFDLDIVMESGIPAKLKMDITNRQVLAKESVTTPAGSWEAFKISYNAKMVIEMGFAIPMKMEVTEWFVPNFGVVRSEHKSGKTEILSIE